MRKHLHLQKHIYLFAGLFWACFLIWLFTKSQTFPSDISLKPNPKQPSSQTLAEAEQAYLFGPDLIVDLDDRMTQEQIQAFAERIQATLIPASVSQDPSHLYHAFFFDDPEGENPASLLRHIEELRNDPFVESVDSNFTYTIPENSPSSLIHPQEEGISISAQAQALARVSPNDPFYKYQWHMDQIHMPDAWQHSQGQGVIVAVIDTGVTQVEDLKGTEFVPGWNFVDDSPNATDDHGHGTHVAGTIAQTTNNGIGVTGVAYQAKIMPIKVLSAGGSGSVAGIAAGIRWAVDHGAHVINMSLGGPFNSTPLAKAVAYAYQKGVTVVCAAGNDGKGRVSYPAANQGAIAVAATQFDETTTFYSNWGKEITIAAPGGNTRVDQNNDGVPDGVMQHTVTPGNITKHDYLLFMGTSMASPHIAGVAALLYGAGVHDPDQIRKLMEETANKPSHYQGSKDPHYGAGIVDAAAAVKRATSRLDTSP